MKVFINGATGFVGAALVRHFARLGHDVIASGRSLNPPRQLIKLAQYIPFDITTSSKPVKADVAIHAAALATDSASWSEYEKSNVVGTGNFMLSTRECARIIYISSSSVYDLKSSSPAVEENAKVMTALSDYGKSKLLGEYEVQKNIGIDQKAFILRPRAIYGPGDRLLLPRLMQMERFGAVISPVKKGIKTSLTHIDNLAAAIDSYLKFKTEQPIFTANVADAEIYELNYVIRSLFREYYQKDVRFIRVPSIMVKALIRLNEQLQFSKNLTPMLGTTVSCNGILNISHAKNSLGYHPSQNFYDSLPALIQWVKTFGSKENYIASSELAPWNFPEDGQTKI